MTKYAELAPNYGKETVQVVNRVRQSRGVVMANFYAVIGNDDSTLLAATYAKKDRSGKMCRTRGLDADDRAAAGIPKGGRSARGVLVVERTGALMFWRLTNVSVQGQEANDRQLFLGLKNLCETATDFKKYKGRYEVGSGTKEDFDKWWSSFSAPEEGVLKEGNIDGLADELGMDRAEFRALVANTSEMNEMLGEMEKLEDLEDDPLDEKRFELSERATRLLAPDWNDKLDTARATFQDLERRMTPTDWPSPYREKAALYASEALGLESTNAKDAAATYDAGSEFLRLREAQRKQLQADCDRLTLFETESNDILEEYELAAGEPLPKALVTLRKQLEDAIDLAEPVHTARDEGRWEDGLVRSKVARLAMRKVHVAVLNHEFDGSLALEVSQATYTTGDKDVALLVDLGNGGVCFAMSLDWLGSGGSHTTDGKRKKGHVGISHLKWQAVYELGQETGQVRDDGIDKVGEDELGSRKTSEVDRDIRKVDEAIKELQRRLEQARAYDAPKMSRKWQKILAETREEQAMWSTILDCKERGAELPSEYAWLEEKTIESTREALETAEEEIQEALLKLEEIELLAEKYRREIESTQPIVDELSKDLATLRRERKRLTDHGHDRLVLARKQKHTYDTLEVEWRAQVVRSSQEPKEAFKAYGLTPGKGGSHDLRDDLAGKVGPFMRARLITTKPGEEARYSISIKMDTEGHALALRVVRPAEDRLDWEIETFDPNFGGFKFSAVDDAVRWFEHLALKCYRRTPWTQIRYFPVKPSGKRTSSGIHDDDPKAGWDAKYKAATKHIATVLELTPAPTWTLRLIERLKLQIDRTVAEAPTELDWRRARNHLRDLQRNVDWLMVYGVEVHRCWVYLGRVLQEDNEHHAEALRSFKEAAGLWASNKPGKGLEEYQMAHMLYSSAPKE